MTDLTTVIAALDADAVRGAILDEVTRLTGRVPWFVDEPQRDDVRPCVQGQRDTLCWQFADGQHVHVCLVARQPWKEPRP